MKKVLTYISHFQENNINISNAKKQAYFFEPKHYQNVIFKLNSEETVYFTATNLIY